jgi:hypothetical protein
VPDGGSYYLVSQCSSAEEFVASFRRYAENESLFIPTTEPLGVGLRGTFAVTLVDGQTMLEGKGEVTSASVRGAGLHGRPGMSIRFSDLDALAREMLIHLARSRALSRPVPLPATLRPRPLPPSVPSSKVAEARARPRRSIATGPMDAATAMADCAILALDVPPAPPRDETPVPTRTEGSVSGAFPRPTAGTADTAHRAAQSGPVPAPRTDTSQSGRLPVAPRTDTSQSGRLPVAPRTDTSQSGRLPVAPRTDASQSGRLPVAPRTDTSQSGRLPVAPRTDASQSGKLPAAPTAAARTEGSVSARLPRPGGTSSSPARTEASQSGRLPAPTGAPPVPARTEGSVSTRLPRPGGTSSSPVRTEASQSGRLPAPTGTSPASARTEGSVSQRIPKPPGEPASNAVPVPASAPSAGTPERSTLKAAVAPPPTFARLSTPDRGWDDGPTSEDAPVVPTAAPRERSAPASVPPASPPISPAVVAATPRPMATPPQPTLAAVAAPAAEADGSAEADDRRDRPSVPSLQGSIGSSLDVASAAAAELGSLTPLQPPTMPTPPAPPAPSDELRPPTPTPGRPRGQSVPGRRPASEIIAHRRSPRLGKDTAEDNMIATWLDDGEEAAANEVAAAELSRGADWTPMPQPGTGTLRPSLAPASGMPMARPGDARPTLPLPADAPRLIAPETTDRVVLRSGGIPPVVRYLAIAAGVLVIGAVIAFAVSGRREAPVVGPAAEAAKLADEAPPPTAAPAPPPRPEALARTPAPPAGAAVAAPPEPAEPSEPPQPGTGAPAAVARSAGSGPCRAQFTSQPPGAEVVVGGRVVGATPLDYAMACRPAVATIRRDRYEPAQRKFTPRADGTKVVARLERPLYTVKLTSSPPGAIVTIGGRRIGKTPVTTKVPGYEKVIASFAKPGFATTTERVYAKRNGTVVSATLKKGKARK